MILLPFKYCNPIELLNATSISTAHCSHLHQDKKKSTERPSTSLEVMQPVGGMAGIPNRTFDSKTYAYNHYVSAGTWPVPWRAKCLGVPTAMMIWLSDLEETFQFALEVPGYFLRLMSLMEASSSGTIILPSERLLGSKIVHIQEKAQHPCWETQGLRPLKKPCSGKTSISSHLGHLVGDHLPFAQSLFLPSCDALIISMPENPLLIHCCPGPVK